MRFKDSQSTVDSCHVFARLRVHGQLFRFVVTCSAMNQHLFSQISNWVRAAFCHKHSTHLAWHRRFPSKLRCLLRHPSYATSLWPLWRWRKSQTLWNLKAREHFNFNVFQPGHATCNLSTEENPKLFLWIVWIMTNSCHPGKIMSILQHIRIRGCGSKHWRAAFHIMTARLWWMFIPE